MHQHVPVQGALGTQHFVTDLAAVGGGGVLVCLSWFGVVSAEVPGEIMVVVEHLHTNRAGETLCTILSYHCLNLK